MALALALNGLNSPSVAAGCSVANLRSLNVVVTDAAGNAVLGLNHKDFSLTEDGRVQSIAVFAFQGPGLDLTPPAAAPNVFRYMNHRLITFLFDFSMMPPNARARAVDDAVEFIRHGLKPGELLSIETVTAGSVETTLDFTDDQTALVSAVNKFRNPDNGVPKRIVADNSLEPGIVKANGRLAPITTICGHLPIMAKKSLLYFSAATNQSGADDPAALTAAANACTKSSVEIYPIGTALGSVAELAAKTGGQVSPGPQAAVDRARGRSEAYYVVGYYSSHDERDGAYRNVAVKLTRPDLQTATFDYSHGYFADKELPPSRQFPSPVCF